MPNARASLFGATLLVFVGASPLAGGCRDNATEDPHATASSLSSPSLPASPTSSGLTPPEPYVMAPDGVTPLNLVQAGILEPNGNEWAVVLGKAFFWDEQSGSDGNACASCHFHAGADTRLRNQLNPGSDDVTKGPNGDTAFGSERSDTGTVLPGHMPSGALADPNYQLKSADLPMHRLLDETNRDSPIVTTTNDRVSSQGAFNAQFFHIRPGQPDRCGPADASVFHVGSLAARQVEPRNTPTFINAAFNFRNFWDTRANNLFNGVGAFGMRDVVGDPADPDDPRNNNRIVVIEHGKPTLDFLRVENASLASQAVAPPVSSPEMSCVGRIFADVGRKLLSSTPLYGQQVSPHDSVLGPYVGPWGRGLDSQYDYASLIRRAFDENYWALEGRYRIEHGRLVPDDHGYTQMELNFSMFWGLAILAYEETQISDRSEFDTLQNAGRLVMTPSFVPAGPGVGGCTGAGGVDPLLVRGCTIFSRLNVGPFVPPPQDGIRGGNCFVCHNAQGGGVGRPTQPLLAEGTSQQGEPYALFITVADVNNVNDLRDQGSANIGLRPVFTDLMSGRVDPYGNPLSFGRQYRNYLDGASNSILDPALQREIDAQTVPPPTTFGKLEVDGAAKAPILRNVALTPPYFSWGGYPNLRQVLKTYNRGLNRRDIVGPGSLDADGSPCIQGDNSGSGPDGNQSWPIQGPDCNTNTTGLIVPLGLLDCDANGETNPECVAQGRTVDDDDLAAVVRFLKALTDERVQCDQAPFDHPELTIFDGHLASDPNHDGRAEDIPYTLPAVGASGFPESSGLCIPNAGDLFAPGMAVRTGGP